MALFSNTRRGEMYTPAEDVNETLPDGRIIQIAVKGQPIPLADAIKAGLVKEPKAEGPREHKAAPAAVPPKTPKTPKVAGETPPPQGDEADEGAK